MAASQLGVPQGGGEMTFTEIGERLGVSAERAHQIYISAMGKLKRKRHLLMMIEREFTELERMRQARTRVDD
jgi:DNA-directed RNA polymerase sigma subunit (sigma70/sigma32)